MTDYRHEIRALIDPEHTELLTDGSLLQQVSVIMTNNVPLDEFSDRWLPPAAITLRPDDARRLAAELLELADRAQHSSRRR
jgi:hypothetical protein